MPRPRARRYSCSQRGPSSRSSQFPAQFADAAAHIVAIERESCGHRRARPESTDEHARRRCCDDRSRPTPVPCPRSRSISAIRSRTCWRKSIRSASSGERMNDHISSSPRSHSRTTAAISTLSNTASKPRPRSRLALGMLARQIARVPDPAALAPVAPEGGFDHAAPSVHGATGATRRRRPPPPALVFGCRRTTLAALARRIAPTHHGTSRRGPRARPGCSRASFSPASSSPCRFPRQPHHRPAP